MIERYYSNYTPVCDECDKRLPGAESFREALAEARGAGWETRNEDGEWLCTCGDCLFRRKGYDTGAG